MSNRRKPTASFSHAGIPPGIAAPFDCCARPGKPVARWFTILLTASVWLLALSANTARSQEISFGRPDVSNPVSVSATNVTHWKSGGYEVLHLQGAVEVTQGEFKSTAGEAIAWVEIPDEFASELTSRNSYRIILYMEEDVVIDIGRNGALNPDTGLPSDRIVDEKWFGRLFTRSTVQVQVPVTELGDGAAPEIFQRARTALESGYDSSVRPAQFQAPAPGQPQLVVSPLTGRVQQIPAAPAAPAYRSDPFGGTGASYGNPQPSPGSSASGGVPGTQVQFQVPGAIAPGSTLPAPPAVEPGGQSVLNGLPAPPVTGPAVSQGQVPKTNIRYGPRDSEVDFNGTFQTNPANPNERIFVGTGGARVVIDDPELQQLEAFRQDDSKELVILADNVVVWQSALPDGTERIEVYLDGNVVFAKGARVIYAERMFYDANFQSGTILDAEVLTSAPGYPGLVRLKADVIQQLDQNNLQAYGAAFTTSRLGVPSYWVQADSLGLNRREVQAFDPESGQPLFDRQTGLPTTEDEFIVESSRNRVYAGNVPVFGWPSFRTNLTNPEVYLSRFSIGNDNIFGTQILTGWNMYQLLGIRNPPQGVKWTGILDYLSERGVALGSDVSYQRDNFLGIPGAVQGRYRGWFLNDNGLDFLGRGRFNIQPEEEQRGRLFLQHSHQFAPGYKLRAEIGYISDRNFLEQFYEREWDTYKDQTTGAWLERNIGTQSFNLTADLRVNDFFTQTNWLPRFDHFVIGQPLAGDRIVYHAHSHIGYAQLETADAPLDAASLATFDLLAGEADVEGVRAGTRHEIDLPLQLGPIKVVPYLLGDATFWGEALDGDSLFRAYGQTGIRASLPVWRVDPSIQSTLWNLNGLAHKVNFEFDASFADASQDLEDLPLYDSLDDDAQEDFRRRFAFETFGITAGGNTPLQFDERFFSLRSGLQGNVSSPSAEIADDLAYIKFGVRQRWQTKRGLPGQETIVDWITFDAETILYPDEDRDNFGAPFGMFDYDFRWYVGDRVALVSDGYFDFFGQGLRTFSAGIHAGRPEVGNLFLGYRLIEGPISSNVITAAATYRMSEKWGFRATSQFDFGEAGRIGQALNMIYIGESFLWSFGVNADFARENVGFRFGFEPRFAGRSRIFNPGGVPVGPAGARFLE